MSQLKISSWVPIFLGIILAWQGTCAAQQQPATAQSRKEQLEVRKLELEVGELSAQKHELSGWLTAILGFLGGVGSTAVTVWAARRARIGALDQAVHEKRIEAYATLVDASAPLAIYFPPAESISPDHCHAMGRAMSAWYFNGGGLLMSKDPRDAYFRLARALTRASLAAELRVPVFPADAGYISVFAVDQYRRELAGLDFDDVEKWDFGGSVPQSGSVALRFKDFLFLQHLSSSLRTELSSDLHSRRRPT